MTTILDKHIKYIYCSMYEERENSKNVLSCFATWHYISRVRGNNVSHITQR